MVAKLVLIVISLHVHATFRVKKAFPASPVNTYNKEFEGYQGVNPAGSKGYSTPLIISVVTPSSSVPSPSSPVSHRFH